MDGCEGSGEPAGCDDSPTDAGRRKSGVSAYYRVAADTPPSQGSAATSIAGSDDHGVAGACDLFAVAASSDASGGQPGEGGSQPTLPLHIWSEPDGFHRGSLAEANALLVAHHYLGPVDWARLVICQWQDGEVVGTMVWQPPVSRRLPPDWFELKRWCLTPKGGPNAGSRMHRAAVRLIRLHFPGVTTLVSYSDPSVGHTGALYRACNWRWAPTWHRIAPPPSGLGSWDGVTRAEPKDRWYYELQPDDRRAILALPPEYERRIPQDAA